MTSREPGASAATAACSCSDCEASATSSTGIGRRIDRLRQLVDRARCPCAAARPATALRAIVAIHASARPRSGRSGARSARSAGTPPASRPRRRRGPRGAGAPRRARGPRTGRTACANARSSPAGDAREQGIGAQSTASERAGDDDEAAGAGDQEQARPDRDRPGRVADHEHERADREGDDDRSPPGAPDRRTPRPARAAAGGGAAALNVPCRTMRNRMPSDGIKIKDPTAEPDERRDQRRASGGRLRDGQTRQQLGALRERPARDDRGDGDRRDGSSLREPPRDDERERRRTGDRRDDHRRDARASA